MSTASLGDWPAASVKPRSLVIDIFADYVMHRSGEVSALTLTRLAELFGVSSATMRVTISRMSKEGWIESLGRGRVSYYGATERLRTVVNESAERILERRNEPWDRRWDVVIYTIPETDRRRRDHLRSKLEWLGYGQFSPGCWMSPHRRNGAVLASLDPRHELASDEFEILEATSTDSERDLAIAHRCWQLDELNSDYGAFEERGRKQLAHLRSNPVDDNDAFVLRILLVYEYRKFPFRDPDLPSELLPGEWLGRSAHSTFVELRELLRVPAFRFFDSLT